MLESICMCEGAVVVAQAVLVYCYSVLLIYVVNLLYLEVA